MNPPSPRRRVGLRLLLAAALLAVAAPTLLVSSDVQAEARADRGRGARARRARARRPPGWMVERDEAIADIAPDRPRPRPRPVSPWQVRLQQSPELPFDAQHWRFYTTPNNAGFPHVQGSTQLQMIPDNRGSAGAVAFSTLPLSPPYAVELQYATYDDDGGPANHSADGISLMFGRNEQSYRTARGLPVGGTRAFIPDGVGFGVHMVTYANRGVMLADGHGRSIEMRPNAQTYTHGQWANVRVEVEVDRVRVYFNNQLMIDRAMRTQSAFTGFAIGAATGAADSLHMIRSVRVAQGASGQVVVVPPGGGSAAGELVANGGFEQPGLPRGGFRIGSTLPGWQLLSGPGFEVQHQAAGSPAEGNHHLELDSHGSTAIYQDLRTQPGARYRLRFSFAARPGTPRATNALEIRWNGEVVGRLNADGRGGQDSQWTEAEIYVRADRPVSRLSFHDVGASDGLGTYLDAVSVQPAP